MEMSGWGMEGWAGVVWRDEWVWHGWVGGMARERTLSCHSTGGHSWKDWCWEVFAHSAALPIG